MQRLVPFLFVLIFLNGCTESTKIKEEIAPKNYFADVKGCFLLYNMKTKTFDKVIGDENCKEQLPACSTFKVPLAVMAFDSEALKDENQVLKWNGVKQVREESNHDHNAKTWMRDSIVWFSQRITQKLGQKKFQNYLNDFDYGNKDISAGIKEAWLISPSDKKPGLKISAYEQVDFMKKLWTDTLPASKRSMQLTREITFLEKSPQGFDLSGKTGSNFYDKEHKMHLGWFISHLKKGEQEYIVVTNISDLKPVEIQGYGGIRAKTLTKQILADQGLW